MPYDLVRLSKKIAHALRHAPEHYGLSLDAEGWVRVDDLVAGLRRSGKHWAQLSAVDVLRVVEATTDKPRYALQGGNIRALHGHSVPEKIAHAPAEPPALLYHGTPKTALAAILREGLKPMSRQYVHLATQPDLAQEVGERRRGDTIVLTIQAQAAHQAGIRFYPSSATVWLAEALPPLFIQLE